MLVSYDLNLKDAAEFAKLHLRIKLFIDSLAALKERLSVLLFELMSKLMFLTTLANHLFDDIQFVLIYNI